MSNQMEPQGRVPCKAIHQFLSGYSRGDAISNEATVLRGIFRAWGYASDLFCEAKRVLPECRADVRDIAEAEKAIRPNDIVLLHLSIGSIANSTFERLDCRKAILYHNITPPAFFYGIQEEIAGHLERGREQASRLAGVATVNLADSAYNANEFRQMGCPDVKVLPLVLAFDALRGAYDRAALAHWRAAGKCTILFVGRCAPNKRVEDVLCVFYYFQRYVEPNSQLILAGSWAGLESYQACLRAEARELQLRDVVFTGSIPQAELNACYRAADCFVCMSAHEGFCIPVIEAMAMDVPVLAYAAGAVQETMGEAGVCFDTKRFDLVAEMMGHLCRPGAFRDAVRKQQHHRIQSYESRNLEQELRVHLSALQ